MGYFTRKHGLYAAMMGAAIGLGGSLIVPGVNTKMQASETGAVVSSLYQEHRVSEAYARQIAVEESNLENNLGGADDLSTAKADSNTYAVNQTADSEELSVLALEDSEAGVVDDYAKEAKEVEEEILSEELEPTAEYLDNDISPVPELYKIGVRHSSVMDIQERLMDLGFMDYSEPTVYYGSATADAVKRFQRQNDLTEDGILGEQTHSLLLSDQAKKYAAKIGMRGDDIRRIQNRLYEMGYLLSQNQVTGYFGDATEAAVKKMQENNNLAVDGKVGLQTTELLYSGEAKPNLLAYGEKSEIILHAQNRLQELGYLTTKPDGEYGNDTEIAVKQFQSRNDLVVDGFLGPTTRDSLNSANAVPNGIMLGDSGDAVKRVQELLHKHGYLSADNMTGYFGEITEQAVKNFQRENNLSVDGNVGKKTISVLSGTDVKNSTSSRTSNTTENGTTNSASSNANNKSSNAGSTQVNGSVSELIRVAKSKVGRPYVYGSKGPNSFDCSGFIYWCLNQVGVKQSYLTSYGWRNMSKYKKITRLSDVRAGDIVVVTGHVGIAAGNGTVVDASSSQGKIVYRQLNSWWSNRFIVAWRIFN